MRHLDVKLWFLHELPKLEQLKFPNDWKEAVKNLNTKKKSLARARACDIFVKTGLSAPRASKAKSRQRHPLVVDGADCWDTRVWEVEFRKVY